MPAHPLFLGSRGIGGPSLGGRVLVVGVSRSLMSPGHFKVSCTQLDPPFWVLILA